jgi:hypothetical protein
LLKAEVAGRYTLMMWVFVSIAIAVILDRWLLAPTTAPTHSSAAHAGRWRLSPQRIVPLGLLLAGLVALIPSFQYNIETAEIPQFVASSAIDSVPQGSVLLTYPFASGQHNLPELWQAMNAMRYRIPDGEIIAKQHLGPLETAFERCWDDPGRPDLAGYVAGARRELVELQVTTILVPEEYSTNPGCAVAFLQQVVGRQPGYKAGAAIWSLAAT